jgi:hypothetical protein
MSFWCLTDCQLVSVLFAVKRWSCVSPEISIGGSAWSLHKLRFEWWIPIIFPTNTNDRLLVISFSCAPSTVTGAHPQIHTATTETTTLKSPISCVVHRPTPRSEYVPSGWWVHPVSALSVSLQIWSACLPPSLPLAPARPCPHILGSMECIRRVTFCAINDQMFWNFEFHRKIPYLWGKWSESIILGLDHQSLSFSLDQIKSEFQIGLSEPSADRQGLKCERTTVCLSSVYTHHFKCFTISLFVCLSVSFLFSWLVNVFKCL